MGNTPPGATGARQRIEGIKNRISGFELVCSGSLHTRTKLCGKPGCRCATDPESRHGPYYDWSRLEAGRLLHSVMSPEEARLLARAIRNYRKTRQLLKKWQNESIKLIREAGHSRNRRKKPGN